MIEPIEIERLGGLAGFGLPGSRLRCRAVVTPGLLPEADWEILVALLTTRRRVKTGPDQFRIRLTGGESHSEVAEADVPASALALLKSELS